MVSGSSDNTLRIWNIYSGNCEVTLSCPFGSSSCLMISSDGRLVSAGGKCTTIWNIEPGLYEQTFKGRRMAINCLSKIGDDRVIYSGGDPTINVWKVGSVEVQQTLHSSTKGVYCLITLADGRIVSGSRDGTIIVWCRLKL